MILSMLPMVAVICVILGLIAAQLTTRYSAMTLLNAILSAVQLFVVFMTFIEILVAVIQAYIFTLLTSIYIGAARVSAEHND